MVRSHSVHGFAVAAMASVGLVHPAASAFAQEWSPERPVELVIGNAPGGAMDRMARLIEGVFKRESLIPNASIVLPRPGGGHAVALAYIKEHGGDPHYLMAVNNLLISNNPLGRSELRYTDFTPISILYEEPMVFAVNSASSIEDAEGLAERLRRDPGSVSFSVSAGLGTTNHMAAVLLANAVDAPLSALRAVSFESGAEGTTAVLGRHVDVVVTSPGSLLQFVESGDLRIIAVAGEERSTAEVLADVPTWKELGYDVAVSSWRGIVAPQGITPEQTAYWEEAFAEFMASDAYEESARTEIFSDLYHNAEDSVTFLAEADQQFRDYLALVGVQAQ